MKRIRKWLLLAVGGLVILCAIVAITMPKKPSPLPVAELSPTYTRASSPTAHATYTRASAPTAYATYTAAASETKVVVSSLTPSVTNTLALSLKVVIVPSCCRVDVPGRDNAALVAEYVCLENRGAAPVDLQGWVVHDHGRKHEYRFGTFTLRPGATVRLHTGQGENTAEDLFWGKRNTAVWNNEGDIVYLLDAKGQQMDLWQYGKP